MSLQAKIQRSMILVVVTTLLVACAITTVAVYRQTAAIVEDELRQEADYIRAAIENAGEAYLREMDAVAGSTRVSLIDADGNVLYDSVQDEISLENHKNRPEIQAAFQGGEGQDIRQSNTVGQEMYYYAVLMSGNTVLRVSKTMDNIFHTAIGILPAMAAIAVVMLAMAVLLSRRQVARLIRPINALDLEHPLENNIYEELTPLLERIDELNRQKDAIAQMRKEFSANVSHELKTPLTSISGYAEIMKSGLVKPEDMAGFSERIYNEARRLITLVEDIMKLSKLDEGENGLEKEEVDLYGLTREIISRLSVQASKKNVHMEVTGEPATYVGVRRILDEMIFNICDNAIKYNKENGSVKIWVGHTLQGIKVIVRDTGIGIPKDQQERIFERFYRVDKSHSRETGGTGLGLSIVKHGALLHGIDVRVASEPGEGTEVEMVFHGYLH